MVLEENGYTRVSEYINARTKVKMECPNGHSFEILPNNWKKGVRCGVCYRGKLKNGVVNQETPNLQHKNPYMKPQIVTPELTKEQKVLFTRYLKLFKSLKSDGVIDLDINDRIFTVSCRGESTEIWIMSGENVLHPKDIYPVYLDTSDFNLDKEYIEEWIKYQVRK